MAEYKDIAPLKEQIADIKKAIHSPNSDYLTGYLCALSVTEGVIAYLPAADVVEVVRCKDCKFFIPDAELDHNEYPNITEADGLCDCSLKFTDADDFCSHGERKYGAD